MRARHHRGAIRDSITHPNPRGRPRVLTSFLTTVANTAIGWHGAASGRVNYQALYFSGGAALVHQPSDQTIGGYSAATTTRSRSSSARPGPFFPDQRRRVYDLSDDDTPVGRCVPKRHAALSGVVELQQRRHHRRLARGRSRRTVGYDVRRGDERHDHPTSGATGTMTADGLVNLPGRRRRARRDLAVRSTDSNNRWIARCDQAGSTIRLYEKTAARRHSARPPRRPGQMARPTAFWCALSGNDHDLGQDGGQQTHRKQLRQRQFQQHRDGIAASGFATGANFVAWPRTVTINEAEGQPTALRHSLLRTGARRWGRTLVASTDATALPVKGQAYRLTFPIWDADGDPRNRRSGAGLGGVEGRRHVRRLHQRGRPRSPRRAACTTST